MYSISFNNQKEISDLNSQEMEDYVVDFDTEEEEEEEEEEDEQIQPL